MYPNPQDALPLPPDPNPELYRKLARDLVRACKSDDPAAVRAWAVQWIRTLANLQPDPNLPGYGAGGDRRAQQLEQFARQRMSDGAGSATPCTLAGARFVIARAHGFLSWPKFVTHSAGLAVAGSPVSTFEAAADAVIGGDVRVLNDLLHHHPQLPRARSLREHRATLLHYVSANGVEGYRQVTPQNIAGIAEILLAAGAEVDAEGDVYGGGCTTLGLVATSAPPNIAGVQQDLIDVLLKHGARMDRPASGGNRQALVHACLANGQAEAAAYLASRGAPLDLAGAAGLGRLDVVKGFFNQEGGGKLNPTTEQLPRAFSLACAYGQSNVAAFLIEQGVAVDAQLKDHGEGHTGLHVAAFHAHLDVVRLLLQHGADANRVDKTWGTPPLIWALTGWGGEPAAGAGRYHDVVACLVASGARVNPDLLAWDKAIADPHMLAALGGKV